MNISVFQLGPLGTNCYIAADEMTGGCAVIDPGASGEALADWFREQKLQPEAVLLTHGHYDHVGGVEALRTRFPGLKVYVHEADTHLTPELSIGLQWTDHYDEGDCIAVDGLSFRVLSTPGHTPGSVCLLCGDVLFCGDTLFAGSCGRTDFPGGSWSQMLRSLARLAALPETLRVLPGHGEDTTLAAERQHNPYVKEAVRT